MIPPEGKPNGQEAFVKALNSHQKNALPIRAEMFAAMAAGKQPDIRRIFEENPELEQLSIGLILGGQDDIPQFGGCSRQCNSGAGRCWRFT